MCVRAQVREGQRARQALWSGPPEGGCVPCGFAEARETVWRELGGVAAGARVWRPPHPGVGPCEYVIVNIKSNFLTSAPPSLRGRRHRRRHLYPLLSLGLSLSVSFSFSLTLVLSLSRSLGLSVSLSWSLGLSFSLGLSLSLSLVTWAPRTRRWPAGKGDGTRWRR